MKTAKHRRTLADVLVDHGLDPCRIVVTYNDLDPLDACADFRNIDDVVQANAHHILDRMHDGPNIPDGAVVMSFVAEGADKARLTAFRRFAIRRPGVVPGDIVYDYTAAHLLHAFIARSEHPHFYDVVDETGLDDVVGFLTVEWPNSESRTIIGADDVDLRVSDQSPR